MAHFLLSLALMAALPVKVLAGDILSTEGFTPCLNNPSVKVNAMNITFNRATKEVVFDVSGTSTEQQNVTAALNVYAYGQEVYSKQFNPCDQETYVQQLCPVPAGTFSASGTQQVPDEYVSKIPSIAYMIPDLAGQGKLQLFAGDSQTPVACVESVVGNGKSVNVPAVQYAAVGVAGAALLVSGISALSAASHAGASTSSPTFTEVVGWFQSMAMNGMLSVQYPAIYRSFTQNFGFSTGLVSWDAMQTAIDNFRASTGGNLTDNSVAYLRNSTIVYATNPSNNTKRSVLTSALDASWLYARDVTTSINGTNTEDGSAANQTLASGPTNINTVEGIKAYAEQLMIPDSNAFMTVLLGFAIVIAAITAGILLFKVILEAWALFGSFPKKLEGFRKRYWWLLAKTITNLILVLYGVWTLYCVYQFKIGDSWAAKVLAGVTLGIFTAILIGFTVKIWLKARMAKKITGDASALYDDKETWVKYSIFYDNYKKGYWWIFVPVIVYMFAKGCVIAGAEGHGMAQCAGQLILDSILLLMLLFIRPFTLNSGNWINIVIQVVRVLSVCCILVFVEELGVSQTTKTITGLVLIVMQAVLTALLAILIAVNALINCFRLNPHRKARKDAEKLRHEQDELTPLDAHNSWLMGPVEKKMRVQENLAPAHGRERSLNGNTYAGVADRDATPTGMRREEFAPLAAAGAHPGYSVQHHERMQSTTSFESGYEHRQPQLPDLEYRGRGIAM